MKIFYFETATCIYNLVHLVKFNIPNISSWWYVIALFVEKNGNKITENASRDNISTNCLEAALGKPKWNKKISFPGCRDIFSV